MTKILHLISRIYTDRSKNPVSMKNAWDILGEFVDKQDDKDLCIALMLIRGLVAEMKYSLNNNSWLTYVCSDSDQPNEIMFDENDAFATGYEYIDVFINNGKKMKSYLRVNWGNEIPVKDDYTINF